MEAINIHPYYHQTSVIIVDDSRDFLVNFSLQLDESTAFQLYLSPLDALQHINDSKLPSARVQNCFSSHIEFISGIVCENLVSVHVSSLVHELSNSNRFNEPSVVIVDYDMPDMNGIEFCKQIRNKAIKKILLTGVADEKLAIESFNKGVIDKFIQKSDYQGIEYINKYISEFQDAYFSEKTSLIKNMLNSSIYGFLPDPAFIKLFNELDSRYGIVEYYLTSNPSGYLLITKSGGLVHLIVLAEGEMQAHEDIIKDVNGPAELRTLVEKREVIPYFWVHDGYYSPKIENWRKYIYLSAPLNESSSYYYAIVEDPEYYVSQNRNILNFSKYLESLDNLPQVL